MSAIKTIATKPYTDQRPGTSGLRKKTRHFQQPHYLENFVQAVFDAMWQDAPSGFGTEILVVGGDGRYYNRAASQTIIRIAAGNGFGRVMVARSGILSTPAMSAVIRHRHAFGGLVLSASHNPGGPDDDFGIKYNVRNGGPAPEAITERIYRQTRTIEKYSTIDAPDLNIDQIATHRLASTEVIIFDGLADYTALMQDLFDFDALKAHLRSGFRMLFDAMHGATGPYARHIFEELLGAEPGSVLNGVPLEDFGGHHPDPNLVHAAELVRRMAEPDAPDFGAACDADGDRNMIVGRNFFVTPGDSVAVIAEHAQRLAGVARSLPTSAALDRVAKARGVKCYETPTGWKYFGSLLDAGLCSICGEESFGTGSDHVREKDGIWAVLSWLAILAKAKKSVSEVVEALWRRFGRSYFQRHDYEKLNAQAASEMLEKLAATLPQLVGHRWGDFVVSHADDYRYTDPVDHSETPHAGIRILFNGGSRIVLRLSGTGTEGATLRVYFERYEATNIASDVAAMLHPLVGIARELLALPQEPSVIT